jgi:CheY-like chemotaxis protein
VAQWEADLVISDLAMPGEDGYALIRELRARGGAKAKLRAIALTALARTEDRQQALAAGFDAHFAKPVQSRELLAAIDRLVHASRAA